MAFIHTNRSWLWAVNKPDDIALKKFIGRSVRVKDDNGKHHVIEIEDLQGNIAHPSKFQINTRGKSYLISMLDFFAQMNGEKVSEEEIKAFDETVFHVDPPKSSLVLPPWLRRSTH